MGDLDLGCVLARCVPTCQVGAICFNGLCFGVLCFLGCFSHLCFSFQALGSNVIQSLDGEREHCKGSHFVSLRVSTSNVSSSSCGSVARDDCRWRNDAADEASVVAVVEKRACVVIVVVVVTLSS